MRGLKCGECGKKITGGFLESNIDKTVVCSRKCADKYSEKLPYKGKPIDHYSRITGYYQNISGWNKGKLAELRDRKRYNLKDE